MGGVSYTPKYDSSVLQRLDAQDGLGAAVALLAFAAGLPHGAYKQQMTILATVLLANFASAHTVASQAWSDVFRVRRSLGDFSEATCKKLFRFSPSEIRCLVVELPLRAEYKTRDRHRFSRMEAFMLTLHRLAYPQRLADLAFLHGAQEPQLCQVYNMVLSDLGPPARHLLGSILWMRDRMDYLVRHTAAVMGTGNTLRIFGWLDGTKRPMGRPGWCQRVCRDGHHKEFNLGYLALWLADGLCGFCSSAFEGSRHDGYMMANCQLGHQLHQLAQQLGVDNHIYADSAFALSRFVMKGYDRLTASPAEQLFNRTHNKMRVAAEMGFGARLSYWKRDDYWAQKKLWGQQLANEFHLTLLLTNCMCCMRGNSINAMTQCRPPTLEAYLQYLPPPAPNQQ